MNQPKSHFRSELAIIPPVARVIAVLVFLRHADLPAGAPASL